MQQGWDLFAGVRIWDVRDAQGCWLQQAVRAEYCWLPQLLSSRENTRLGAAVGLSSSEASSGCSFGPREPLVVAVVRAAELVRRWAWLVLSQPFSGTSLLIFSSLYLEKAGWSHCPIFWSEILRRLC